MWLKLSISFKAFDPSIPLYILTCILKVYFKSKEQGPFVIFLIGTYKDEVMEEKALLKTRGAKCLWAKNGRMF